MSYVLVVDDEETIRKFLRRRLEGWNYTVRDAASATEALEMMLAEPASIAIIDIRMPGRDGLWLAEQVRQRWNKTAIIMATGAGDIGSIEKSRKLGAVDYVLKPFDRELLRQAMERAANPTVPTPDSQLTIWCSSPGTSSSAACAALVHDRSSVATVAIIL